MAKSCFGLYYEHKSKGRTVKKMVKMLQGGRTAAPARTRAEKRARGRQRRRRVLTKLNQSKSLYLFLIPAIVYFIIFCYLPMYGVQIAFKYYSPRLGIWGSTWTGMENLNRFFDSYYFWRLLRNTVGLSLYNLIVAFPFPILLALAFNEVKSPKLKKAVQTISYAPHFISVVVLVGILNLFFNQGNGLINVFLDKMGFEKFGFLTSSAAFPSMYVWSGVWQNAGWKESYSQDQTQAAAKVNAGQVGFVARAQNTQWMGAAAENYVQCPVLEGPYGDRALINVESNVQMTGVAVITTANKYPEATMRWLDYFYSEEGTVLCRLGIEGESYEVVDGKYQLLDNIKNNPDGLTLDQALGQWAIFPGGYLPQYITNEVDQSAAQLPETKAANDVVRDYVVPFETVPRVKFTEEESIKLGTYAQDIVNYATENVVKFITGEKSLSEWDAYVAELNNMPVEDYIKINQDAYDRWKG